MKRYFEISTHVLVITAFMALAFTGRLDTPAIVIFTLGVFYSLYRTLHQSPSLLGARTTMYLSCGYIVFLMLDIFALSSSFIPATVHMVLFLELTKLYQEKSDRDYFYLFVLAFLMVLAAASLTVDFTFIITLSLFLIALIASLMSFEIVRSQRASAAETHSAQISLTGISTWATIWVVIFGAIIFFALPRIGTGYFSRANVASVLQSGFNEHVQLGEIGEIKLSSAVVMRAKRVGGKPSSGLKWRGLALDRFDGHAWYMTDLNRENVPATESGIYPVQPLENAADAVRYDILLEPLATTTLFGPYHIRSVNGRLQGVTSDHDDSVFTRVPQQRRIQYQVLSEIPNRTRPAIDTPTPGDMQRYLELPEDIDPRVNELAHTIAGSTDSPLEKVSLIESYLRKNYRYTLKLSWAPGSHPLETFLFDAKNGHCEYFASAMAILARAAGIPTRLVNGFLMGEFNPIGMDYIVRESDAHSWVEAYVPGRGWMEFDATPPDMRPTDTGIGAQISHYVDAMELVWHSYILVYDYDSQSQLFRSAQDSVQNLQTDFRNGSTQWSAKTRELADRISKAFDGVTRAPWFWIAVLITFLGTASLRKRRFLAAQWRIWKIRSGLASTDRDVVEHLFYKTASLAGRRMPARLPAQTWREWAMSLPDANRRTIMLRALAVFEKSLYGHAPASKADFTILESAIRAIKELNGAKANIA